MCACRLCAHSVYVSLPFMCAYRLCAHAVYVNMPFMCACRLCAQRTMEKEFCDVEGVGIIVDDL